VFHKKKGLCLSGNCGLAEKFSAEDCFPDFKKEVLGAIILFEVTQVGVEPEAYFHSGGQGRSIERHRIEVRKFFGVHAAMLVGDELSSHQAAAALSARGSAPPRMVPVSASKMIPWA
jgi:hypothetical protein